MANSKTSLNGYEYGRKPKTTAPFWAGSGEGAEIDDTGVYTDKTWSSKKISDELAEKAEASYLANYAKVTAVYTKSESYSKAEVDALIDEIPAVDAYTKAQTDSLLDAKANASDVYTKSQVDNLIPDVSGLATKTELNSGLGDCAKVTSVYTKSESYSKSEVDDLISGVTPTPTDAYTKAQTDDLLADKANASDVYTKTQTDNLLADKADSSSVYTKTQTDNLLADKADSSSVYTKTQTDNLLADKANSSDVYSKSQTYTKTEVDDLISQSGGGGAEIDDTSVAANKVWSSSKTRNELLKASGLEYTSYIATKMSLIRAKAVGTVINDSFGFISTPNAKSTVFTGDYQYSLPNGTITVTIWYADGSAGQSYTINLTDIPWNDVASADVETNYPSDNSRWKTIVASEDIFEICIGGNVASSAGGYYPYIFVRVPKGTYTASISLASSLGSSAWQEAGKVSVINGYVNDPTEPIKTYDITSLVSNSSVSAILGSTFPKQLVTWFKRDVATVQKLSKFVIEGTKVDSNGNTYYHKSVWNIKSLQTLLPHSSSQNMQISHFVAEFVKDNDEKWIYDQPEDYSGTLYKVTETIPSTTGNVTGSKVADTTTKYDTLVFGYASTWDKWEMKLYV